MDVVLTYMAADRYDGYDLDWIESAGDNRVGPICKEICDVCMWVVVWCGVCKVIHKSRRKKSQELPQLLEKCLNKSCLKYFQQHC